MQRYINPYRFFQGAMVPNCIMRLRDLSQTAKLMYGRLCQYAGQNGEAWPKLETLGHEVGLAGWRQAHRVITELKNYGLLEVVKRPSRNGLGDGRNNSYLFLAHPVFFEEETGDGGGGSQSSPPRQKNGPPKEIHDSGNIQQSMPKRACNGHLYVRTDILRMSNSLLEENKERESGFEENQKKTRGRSAPAAEPSDSTRRGTSVDQPAGEKKQPELYSEQDLALARHMVMVLTANNPGFRPPSRVERWAHEIRLIRERDQRPEAEIGHVFDFAAGDAFWRQNILSPGALRRNYAKLTARMIAQGSRYAPSIEREKPVRFCRDCRDFGKFDCVDNKPDQVGCCIFRQRGNQPRPMAGRDTDRSVQA